MKEKKYLMVLDCMVDKVSDKMKEMTGTKNIDNTKILIETDDKFPDAITLRMFWY